MLRDDRRPRRRGDDVYRAPTPRPARCATRWTPGAVRHPQGDRGEGEELLAIYHSHTKSAAYPSQTDVNLAFWQWSQDGESKRALAWPGTMNPIASLAEGEEPLRGFDITEVGEVVDVDLVVE